MSNKGKVIYCRNILPLEPSDSDVNETKIRLTYLDYKIKENIVDYINAISENNIQTPDVGEDDLIPQLPF